MPSDSQGRKGYADQGLPGKPIFQNPAGGNRKGYAAQGGEPIPEPPVVGGAGQTRPQRIPHMPSPYGININNNYSPATSQGYSWSNNQGQSQGVNQSYNQSGTRVDPLKMGMYQQLLGMNVQNYQNQLGAYNTGQQELRNNLGGVYGQLPSIQNTLGMGQVLGQNGNWGVASPAAQAIAQNQARQAGKITQGMTNAGLGNTTAAANLQNQNVLQANQAYGALGADLAGRAAQFQQQGINTQMQGAGMQADAAWRAAQAYGQQFGNTFGNLDTSFSQGGSYGMNNSFNQGQSYSQNMSQSGNPGSYGDMGGQMQANPFGDQNLWAQAANVAGPAGPVQQPLIGANGPGNPFGGWGDVMGWQGGAGGPMWR